ncbi:hypothetical protein QFZ97_005191 [Paraburkholderia youngii]
MIELFVDDFHGVPPCQRNATQLSTQHKQHNAHECSADRSVSPVPATAAGAPAAAPIVTSTLHVTRSSSSPVVPATPPSRESVTAAMTDDDQIDLQIVGEKRNLVEWFTDREMTGRANSARGEFLQALVEQRFGGFVDEIDRHRGRDVRALHPRRIVEHGKQVHFRVQVVR